MLKFSASNTLPDYRSRFSLTTTGLSLITTLSLSAPSYAQENKKEIEIVGLGKTTFTSKGCAECHGIDDDTKTIKTGPSLYALFQKKEILHKVKDSAEEHTTELRANKNYYLSSLKNPALHLAYKKGSNNKEAYPAIMPNYSKILTELEMDAIYAYLGTLNKPENATASKHLLYIDEDKPEGPDSHPEAINTYGGTKVFRTYLNNRSTARSIHVGLANGQNYTFDPKTLAIQSVWTGRFLDLRNEIDGRGGKANKMGEESKQWDGSYTNILRPQNARNKPFDNSLSNTIPRDFKNIKDAYKDEAEDIEGNLLGYSLGDTPKIHYKLGNGRLSLQFHIAEDGEMLATVTGNIKKPVKLTFPADLFEEVSVKGGSLDKKAGVWRISNLTRPVTWKATPKNPITADQPNIAEEVIPSKFEWKPSDNAEDLVGGYTIESADGPKYRTSGSPLFEPTGIDFDKSGTPIIGSRSAGIWKITNGMWQPYALGTFEVLGLKARPDGSIIVSQKPELTRIMDTNKDGVADAFQTLADEFRFTGNYHAYTHGPAIDSKGNIHFNLNLQHIRGNKAFKAGGKYMGSIGGYRGWNLQVDAKGNFTPYAYGMRSSAGLEFSPKDTLYYTDNQGEYMSTSKLFKVVKGGYYGHPGSIIDFKGETEESVMKKAHDMLEQLETAVVLMPHSKVANSPGNPVWDTTKGAFGPFTGQIFIGDQTLSNIHRVHVETVNGVEQGSIMPFANELPSGPMRITFSPAGEMWIGQTGRGWASKGGNLSALQKIKWSGKVEQSIHRVEARKDGFEVFFNTEVSKEDQQSFDKTKVESWYYIDSHNYGSKELGKRNEKILASQWSRNGKSLKLKIDNFGEHRDKSKDVGHTSRVYMINLNDTKFSEGRSEFHTKAYYTLNEIPK